MTEPAERLSGTHAAGLYRRLRTVGGAQGPHVTVDGRRVLLLCSNNYLGLTDHPSVLAACARAAERWGTGAGSSRLISGTMEPHAQLEAALAEFHRSEAALVFGSGYLANLGVVSALSGPGEVVFSDELNHASIIDGCRLSGAEKFIYRHRDTEHLAWGLRKAGGRAALIASDGIFSMDGDLAPIERLARLAREHRTRLMIDEAHAIGTIGPGGRGVIAAAGLEGEVDVVIGTLGKSLASYGAYACVSAEVRDLLINSARSFIYSTALAPPAVAAARAALETVTERPDRIRRLISNATALRESLEAEGLDTAGTTTHIVPVMIGEAAAAVAAAELALERGVYAQAIRPPTVPEGTSRLRLSVMATHRENELRQAGAIIGEAVREATALRPPAAAAGQLDRAA